MSHSHSNAKATRILATNCCVCGCELVDAKSVELGIGPVCRKRYGKVDIETTDIMRRRALGALAVSGLDDDVINQAVAAGKDARTVCNVLVYWASAHYTIKTIVLACTPVIRILGYTTLADKLESDRSTVKLTTTDDGAWLEVKCPRNDTLIRGAYRLGGRIVRHPDSGRFKCWAFPSDAETKGSLALLLGVCFPNEYCHADGNTYTMDAVTWDAFAAASLPSPTTSPAPKPSAPTTRPDVSIEDKGKFFILHTPYNPAFISAIRAIRGRRYEGGDANSFPTARRQTVVDLVERHYGVTL